VNLFVSGMRRSGTTILYDALLADPGLTCFYEPLREQKVTVGGGSGARETDPMEETRALREDFARRRYPDVAIAEFNWGGPRDPDRELDGDLPDHCLEFLRELLATPGDVAIKETRFYCKVPVLAQLDPEAVFVHVARDPRAVAASIVLGRGRKRLRKLKTPDGFFAERSERRLWSQRRISELLLERPEYDHVEDPTDVVRVLMTWKLTLEATRTDGRRLFGDRYVMVRNEDLRADPAGALERIYDALGREVPEAVAAWADENVASEQDIYAADDPRWREAFELIGLGDALAASGYELEAVR
jgi:hypothetical protein